LARVDAPADEWDSGWIDSTDTGHRYDGPALDSRATYRWTVRLRDELGRESDSAEATFETGLRADEWAASWVGRRAGRHRDADPPRDEDISFAVRYLDAPLYLRRSTLLAPVRRARVHVTARGVYELRVNGSRVGDLELAPGWTDYNDRILYQSFDITDLLVPGENVFGAIVAGGWWSGYVGFDRRRQAEHYGSRPALWMQAEIEHTDGTVSTIVTDGDWLETEGALRYADLLMGEYEDARLALSGWDTRGFDAGSWHAADVVDSDSGRLSSLAAVPIRPVEIVPARSVRRVDDRLIVDFGQNLVGKIRVEVGGLERDDRIMLRHGEMLDEHGEVYTANLRTVEATDVFVSDGAQARFEPRFTSHGFRFAEIRGAVDSIDREHLSAVVVRSDNPEVGTFETGSAKINRLQSNIRWGQRSNFLSVPTDCPQRDERLGWLADAQVFFRTAAYNADVAAFFRSWLRDVRFAQDADGAFPDVAPRLRLPNPGAPGWGDAGVILPVSLYEWYGDVRFLEDAWDSMAAWVEYVHRNNPDLIWRRAVGHNFGDWLEVNAATRRDVLATAYFAHSARLLARAATVLGRHAEARGYADLSDRIAAAFRDEFVTADGIVSGDTQTGYLVAIAFGLVDGPLREACGRRLATIVEEAGPALTTGFVGVGLLLPTLHDLGRADLAWALALREDYPSWLYSVARGATTIWERWDGWTEVAGFQSAEMNSFNHYSLGSIGEWFYSHVIGIRQMPGSIAFERLQLEPSWNRELGRAEGSFDSPRGLIVSGWRVRDDALEWTVELPPGVSAVARVEGADIRESGLPVEESGLHILDRDEDGIRVELGSGRFDFTSTLPRVAATDLRLPDEG
jgi:alpha-L-rhamnosidase